MHCYISEHAHTTTFISVYFIIKPKKEILKFFRIAYYQLFDNSHHVKDINFTTFRSNCQMVIQRSWKILSESGSADSGGSSGGGGGSGGSSTPASFTEANRSPIGLNTSSDDSNCSNQTANHFVVTTSLSSSPLCSNSNNNNKFELQNAANTLNLDTSNMVDIPFLSLKQNSKLYKLIQCFFRDM